MKGWWSDGYGLTGFAICVICVAGVAAILAVLVVLVWQVELVECHTALRELHRGGSFHLFGGGCYVDVGHGEALKIDNYNGFRPVK